MKFETLMLRTLFAACLLVCGLLFGAMLVPAPHVVQLAADSTVGALLLAAPATCQLPADRVMCAR